MTINIEKLTTVTQDRWGRELSHVRAHDVPRPIVIRVQDLADGIDTPPHAHERAQLLYASKGAMEVTTPKGVWVVPSHRAVWIPPLTEHAAKSNGPLHLRNTYFSPDLIDGLPSECRVVTVTPLLRELLATAATLPELYDEHGPDARLLQVILDQVKTLSVAPLHLPSARHPKIRAICDILSNDPADGRSMDDFAKQAAVSPRTLARLFEAETGLGFREWRQQARLLKAMTLLAEGAPISRVAYDLGYASQSAFIAMFKKVLGTTPGRYFAET